MQLKVIVMGLGYIGRMVVEALQSETPFWNRKLVVVGAVDIVPESRKWSEKKGVRAYQSLSELLIAVKPDVCIHTTSSGLESVFAQLKELATAKIPVVSSCEELFHPWENHAELALELDRVCKNSRIAVMGTGANPGFVMDVLPALVTQCVHTVEQIRVERIVNASTRRPPLQKKIGAGLDEPTFRAQVEAGRIGHIGLMESLDYLAAYMGWKLGDKGQSIEPILASKEIKTQVVSLKKGDVAGLHHRAWGNLEGGTAGAKRKRVIELDLKMAIDAANPQDKISIKGNPAIELMVPGGTPGDPATVSSLVRGLPIVLQAKPGIVRRLERDHFVD